MSSALPFEIIALIIDIVGEKNDTILLKELAFVSYSFLQICSKHLFATVKLHNANNHRASSKKGFVKLLKSRPDVVKYIRKLSYNVTHYVSRTTDDDDDYLLSSMLLNFLPTFSRLNSLTITALHQDWNTLHSSLTSALLQLMHLPTINHINLSSIRNFPLFSFTPSVNLLRLDIHDMYLSRLDPVEEDGSPGIIVQSEIMPKIREFRTLESTVLTTRLLHAKRQDGLPAFDFMDLRRLSMSFNKFKFEDKRNVQYVLQNAKLLENLCLSAERGQSLVGLLSPSAPTLKVLELSVPLQDRTTILGGTCEELEVLAGHNVLEVFYLEVHIDEFETVDDIGSAIQEVEQVLVKPGWSALRQVSFHVLISQVGFSYLDCKELCLELQDLPDKYLSNLSKLESVAFNYSSFLL
jgi:hypothetical protein